MTVHLPPAIHPDADAFLVDCRPEMPPSVAVSVLDGPGSADSPCGPVRSDGAPWTAHSAGPVCPCAERGDQ